MTPLSFGGAPGVAVLGELNQLRRRGSRWRLRDWRLRTKLTAVLLMPLLLAGVLGTLRVNDSLSQARELDTMQRQVVFAQHVGAAVHDLQRERRLAVEALARTEGTNRAQLQAQIQRVDLGVSGLSGASSGASDLGPAAQNSYQTALQRLDGLGPLRQATLTRSANPEDALNRYTDVIAGLLDLNRAVLTAAKDPLDRQGTGLAALTVAKEQLSQQHSVLLSALLTGNLSPSQQASLRNNDARLNAALDEFEEAAPPAQRQLYADTVSGGAVVQGQQLLDTALNQAPQAGPPAIQPTDWDAAATATTDRVREVESSLLEQLRADNAALSADAWHSAIRDAVVVAVLMALAVVLLIIVVRSLLKPLRTLRTGAFDVADSRLPDAVEKLRITDGSVGETVVDPVPVYSRDEVGQVARAFDTVHLQAVRLAAEQAILRNTVNDIFLNLAGRSQRLVERQLTLIDELENAEQDPEQLASLFQLDHLATRMRRNSENLLVLAGGTLRSVSQHGIAVLDLLRAAVSEIEEYQRVTLRRPPAATVTGPAVNDLVHLIAELLDNATISAPPDAPVTLSSSLSEDGGLLVEITDCGTGLSPTELHEINERLASPPMVDVAVSQHMGLFVVSRLAARHGIRVRLRQQQRDFGITASVLLPADLVATDQTPTAQVKAVPTSIREVAAPMPTIRAAGVPDAEQEARADREEAPEQGGRFADAAADYHAPAGHDATADYDATAEDDAGPEEDGPQEDARRSTEATLPPIAVSVVDAQAHDLFNPSSIGHIPMPQRMPDPQREPEPQRSAVEEWVQLFGRDEPEQEPVHGGEPPPESPLPRRTTRTGDPAPPQRAASPVPPARSAPSRQPGRNGADEPQVREEIYEAVSAWFQEQQAAPASTPTPSVVQSDADLADTPPKGFPRPFETASPAAAAAHAGARTPKATSAPGAQAWQSVADEGWNAADAVRAQADYDLTEAGLPRRRPRAQLVPGTAGGNRMAQPFSSPAPTRTADEVRGRLSSYQRGLRHGRHARLSPDEQATRAAVPQGRLEEDQQ